VIGRVEPIRGDWMAAGRPGGGGLDRGTRRRGAHLKEAVDPNGKTIAEVDPADQVRICPSLRRSLIAKP
jgi:hypothetical protein